MLLNIAFGTNSTAFTAILDFACKLDYATALHVILALFQKYSAHMVNCFAFHWCPEIPTFGTPNHWLPHHYISAPTDAVLVNSDPYFNR